MPPAMQDDTAITATIGSLLRAGVLSAAVVLLVGGGVFLARHHAQPAPDRGTFEPQPDEFSRPAAIYRAARAGNGRAIVQLGLILLIATPILRVAFSALAFARRREYVYVIIPLVVLGVLIAGLLSGQAG